MSMLSSCFLQNCPLCSSSVRVADLLDTFDDGFLVAFRPVGNPAEIFPPRSDGTRKVIHEMLNSAFAAGQMEQHRGPHDTPAQPGSPADCRIGVGDVDYAEVDQVHHLAI